MDSPISVSKNMQEENLIGQEVSDSQREQWSSKIDFILSAVGLCVGLGNIWRFPYLCYENGGGAFLIPYLLTLIFAGVPVLFLELIIGQMKSVGGLGVWKYCIVFKGVGYAAVIMAFWLSVYYIVILAYAIVYMYNSITLGPLPWSTCDNSWNTKCCPSNNMTSCINAIKVNNSDIDENSNVSSICSDCKAWTTPVVEFWEIQVLGESSGIDSPGYIQWQLALALFVAWLMCFFCILKGVKWTGKIIYFTSLFPYFVLICLFVRVMTLPGSVEGIKLYLIPDVSKLTQSKVWLDGATQVFFSYGLGLGTHIALGSYNKYKNNCHRDAIIVGIVNVSASLLTGLVVFSVLGFVAETEYKMIMDFIASGQDFIFIVYPAALSRIPGSKIWSPLFFLMIIFLGFTCQFYTLEGILAAIIDELPNKFRKHRKLLLLSVCTTSYLIGLSMVTQGGAYVFRLFDHYSVSGMALLFLIFCECIAFSWCYGIDRFMQDCQRMLGFKLINWWKLSWFIYTPLVCACGFIFTIITFEHVKNKDKKYPYWALMIGIILALSSIIMIPAYLIYYTAKQLVLKNGEQSIPKTLREIFRPSQLETDDTQDNIQMTST